MLKEEIVPKQINNIFAPCVGAVWTLALKIQGVALKEIHMLGMLPNCASVSRCISQGYAKELALQSLWLLEVWWISHIAIAKQPIGEVQH